MDESTRVRVLAAVTATVATAGAAAMVLRDPHPISAPLHPPVAASSVVLVPQSCGTAGSVVDNYRRWKAAPNRRTFMRSLPPSQRLDLQAYISNGGDGTCPTSGQSSVPRLQPGASNVVGGGADTTSYVS